MESWERFKIIANALSILAIPIVLAFIGYLHSSSIKNREIESRFVELAVDILRSDAVPESRNLREWAVDVVDTYSGVRLNREARNDLIMLTSFPNPIKTEISEKDCSELFLAGIQEYNSGSYAAALSYLEDARSRCGDRENLESYIARTKEKLKK